MTKLQLSLLAVSAVFVLAAGYSYAAVKAAQTGPVIVSINELGDTQLTPARAGDTSRSDTIAYGR